MTFFPKILPFVKFETFAMVQRIKIIFFLGNYPAPGYKLKTNVSGLTFCPIFRVKKWSNPEDGTKSKSQNVGFKFVTRRRVITQKEDYFNIWPFIRYCRKIWSREDADNTAPAHGILDKQAHTHASKCPRSCIHSHSTPPHTHTHTNARGRTHARIRMLRYMYIAPLVW